MPRISRICRFCGALIRLKNIAEGWEDVFTNKKACAARGAQSASGHRPSNKPPTDEERKMVAELSK